jgi:alpha-tubulin suppressor-like RCC1 family protein
MNVLRSFRFVFLLLALGSIRSNAAFPNAWQITDNSNSVSSTTFYSTNLISVQNVAATNLGFRYTVTARLVDDFGGAESLGFRYSPGTNRFSVLFDFDSDGNLLAAFPTNGGPTTIVTLTTNRNAARAYHAHEVSYVPATRLATYSFDGAALYTWSGEGATGVVGQVSWGALSDAGQGQMNFRNVQFRVNNTNILSYDAGSATTSNPLAPGPTTRRWTFSGPGTGTATNDVSPDNFWQPTIILNGANPFIAPWTSPFTDPGAFVFALPVSLEAGLYHSLALKADGSAVSWGDSSFGQTNAPADATNLITLAAGDSHTIALRGDRSVLAWGDNSLGQTNVPASATNVVSLAAGRNHNIVLRANGTVVTWGNDSAITNAPAIATNIVAVAAGQFHNLALRSTGAVLTWGFATGSTNIPNTVTSIVAIAAGSHNVAVRSNGTVVAWGDNTHFQTNVPPTATNVIAIAAGVSHCLALRSNGTLVAWGAGVANTGVAPQFGQSIIPAHATNIVAIAAGDFHSLALRADGTVIAWGAGTNISASPHLGQSVVPGGLSTFNLPITTNGSVNPNVPGNYTLDYLTTNSLGTISFTSRVVVVQFTYPFATTLPATASNTIATLHGTVNPKGFNTTAWFEWGVGSRFDQTTAPANVGSGTSAVALNANLTGLTPGLPYRFRLVASNNVNLVARGVEVLFTTPTIALLGSNPATNVWGLNFAEVGTGITGTGNPLAVTGGRAHSLALKADGDVTAWGDNFYNQTNVPGINGALAIAAGLNHSVAVNANGIVSAWGDNSSGQTTVPASISNTVAVAAGESHSLALRSDLTLSGWGDNFYGQASAPGFATNVIAIAAGQRHNLALFTGGNLAAWGYNGFGQTNIPASATNIVAIGAGSGHSLALRADRTVFAWGLNSYFQTNLPASATNVIAIAAGYYHSLALRADGTVVAWGAGTNYTGGTPHFGQSIVPASATNVIAIGAGYYHSFAIKADGSVIAWGAGTSSSGFFPNYGQAIVPTGLNTLNNLSAMVSGVITNTLPGNYVLRYLGLNPFGGLSAPLTRTVSVTAPPAESWLSGMLALGNGTRQFSFTNATPTSFTVLASTNVSLPTSNWTVIGAATQLAPGVYQFTDTQATNFPQRFYQIRSP